MPKSPSPISIPPFPQAELEKARRTLGEILCEIHWPNAESKEIEIRWEDLRKALENRQIPFELSKEIVRSLLATKTFDLSMVFLGRVAPNDVSWIEFTTSRKRCESLLLSPDSAITNGRQYRIASPEEIREVDVRARRLALALDSLNPTILPQETSEIQDTLGNRLDNFATAVSTAVSAGGFPNAKIAQWLTYAHDTLLPRIQLWASTDPSDTQSGKGERFTKKLVELAEALNAEQRGNQSEGGITIPIADQQARKPGAANNGTGSSPLSPKDLAGMIEESVAAVESFLRRYRAKFPDCFITVDDDDRRRNEPKYLYRVADVLPALKEHFGK
jgi:hypothetical protein